jgi:hypothetical protein
MRGVVQIPVEDGKKELGWYVGKATVNGLNTVNPVVSLRVERDADFVAKKLFLVQWPSMPGVAQDPNLSLPAQAAVTLKDGGTRRPLSLVAGLARGTVLDATPRPVGMHLGLPCPFLIRSANNLYAEISNPAAAGTAWTGDLYLVAEGYKVYPMLPEEIPAKVKSYAVPYQLNANGQIQSPAAAAGNIAGQVISITNDGQGKFLAKGMLVSIKDATGLDKTQAIMPALGFQILDSTAGNKGWVNNGVENAGIIQCPSALMSYQNGFIPFNQPRYIDPVGNLKVQVVFSDIPAVVAALNAAAAWPVVMSVAFFGALLPL